MDEIEKLISNYEVDPNNLDRETELLLDQRLREAPIDGMGNFDDYKDKFRDARRTIATRLEEGAERDSFLGSRGSFELAGELSGSFVPYILDRKKLTNYYENNNYKTKIGDNFKQKFFNVFDKVGNTLENITLPKRGKVGVLGAVSEPLFKRTGALIKSVSKGKFDETKPLVSQAEATFTKSFFGGVGGAGLGSVGYDAYNLSDNYAAAVQADLAGVTENEVFDLPPLDRIATNAQAAMTTSLIFSGGAVALTPLARLIKGKTKTLLGLDTKESKALAEQALEKGINLNIPSLASEDKFIGKLVKNYYKTVGILPVLGGIGEKFRKRLAGEVGQAGLDMIQNMAPVQHATILGYNSQPIIRANMFKNAALISEQYELVKKYGDYFQKQIGLEGYIPMTNLAKGAKQFRDDFLPKLPGKRTPQSGAFTEPVEDKRLQKVLEDSDFAYLYAKFADFGMTDSATGKFIGAPITLREWFDMKQILNDVISKEAPDSRAAIKYSEIMKLMDDDLAAVSNKGTQNSLLLSPQFKGKYDNILATEGQEAANEYMNKVALGSKTFGDMLTRANEFFVQNIQPFASKTADDLKKIDSYLFTVKGLIPGFEGKKAVDPSDIYHSLFRKILVDGSPESVTRMQQIMGAIPTGKDIPGTEYGSELYKRLVSRTFYDNFIGSFDLQNFSAPVKLAGDIIKDAKDKGVYAKYLDEAFDASYERNDNIRLKFLTPESVKSGIGDVDFKELRANFSDLGEFDVNTFIKNFGLSGTAEEIAKGEARLGQIYAGLGHNPKESVETFKKFSNLVRTAFEFEVGDTSKFLTRRIGLGAGVYGALALGGAQAGLAQDSGVFGNLGGIVVDSIVPTLMWRYGSKVLASPRTMKSLMDVYTPRQRQKKIGKGGLFTGDDFSRHKPGLRTLLQPIGGNYLDPSKRRTLAAIVNNLTTEDPGAPKVDLDKLDFQEVQDYLLNSKPKIPLIDADPTKMFDEKELKQRHPDIYASQFLSDEERTIRQEFQKGEILQGVQNDEESNVETNAALPVPMSRQEQSAISEMPTDLPTVVSTRAPTAPVSREASFEALFPNDPTGQLIAQRGQRNA